MNTAHSRASPSRPPFLVMLLLVTSCSALPTSDLRAPQQGPAAGRLGWGPQHPPPQRPPPPPRALDSKFELYLGVRALDEDDWAPVEDQRTIGLEYVHEHPDSVFGFELGVFASEDTKDNVPIPGGGTVDVRGRTSELSIGIRKTFGTEAVTVHPYLGGGLAAIRAEFRGVSGGVPAKDEDDSTGVYLHGGIDIDIGPSAFLGIDLRCLRGTDITLFGASGTADYVQFALVLGVAF
jgi:hypothetical protein